MLLFIPAIASAEGMSFPLSGDIEITSPFGWRVHPIFGTEIFHSGIDIGAEEGQLVFAAATGIVSYAGWMSGYGNTVVLDHGNGLQTLYAHNEEVEPLQGQVVSKGEAIALAGSTGNSTGPHCHFEVDQDGDPVDPATYLDGSIPVSDGKFSSFFKSDYNFIPINFDASVDFAKPIRDTATAFSKQCTVGLGLIKDKLNWLFIALITMDFAFAAMWVFFYNPNVPIFQWLLSKCLFYGFLVFMLTHWGDWVANVIKDFFTTMGGSVTGSTAADAGKIVSDPSSIMQKGAELVGPLFTYAGTFSGPAILLNAPIIAMTLILALAIMICFALITYQIVLAYIEFYIVALFSAVSFTLSGMKQIRKYGNYGINALIAVSVKLMFFCVFAVLLTTTLQNLKVSDYFSMGGIESKVSSDNGKDWSAANSASTIDQFMVAIRQVESGNDYFIPSDDGYGYGAYQISYSNWNNWCTEAGVSIPAEWTPENQDTVARCIMLEYYNVYGNWHDVAVAWNGGDGAVGQKWSSTESYAAKVEAAFGHPLQKTLNMVLLFSMLVVSLFFLLIGSRISESIMIFFGGPGFGFSIERDDEI